MPLLGLCVLITLQLATQTAVAAAYVANNQVNAAIGKEQIKIKIEELKTKSGVDEATKALILNLYQATQENLVAIDSYNKKALDFEVAINKAPLKTKQFHRELEQAQQKPTKQKLEDLTKISDLELEQRLNIEKDKANAINEKANQLEQELIIQNNRPENIRKELADAKQNLEATQKKLEKPINTSSSKLEIEANQTYLETQIVLYTSKLKMLSIEANSNQIRVDALKAELQLLVIQKSQQDAIVDTIENLVNLRRQQEAIHMQRELTQAEKTLVNKPSVIQQITRENISLSRDLQLVNAKLKNYGDQKNDVELTATQIDSDFKSAQKKIDLAGLSPVLGKILRKQRRNLPTLNDFAAQSETVQNEIAQATLELFQVEDRLKQLANLDDYLKEIINHQIDAKLTDDDKMMIQAELRVLLNNQTELLNKLSASYSAYIRALGDFDFAKQQMLVQANKFANYLDERLLWVPSSEPVNSSYFINLYKSLRWFCSPKNWLAVLKDIATIVSQNLLLTLLTLVGSLFLPISKNWAKRQLSFIAEKVGKIYTDDFNFTLKALGYTLIMALPLPFFFYYLGWFLNVNPHAADFSKAVGLGLQTTAVPLFVLQFLYRLFAVNGIAVRHFQWQQRSAALLHKQAAWLRLIIVPGMFVIACTGAVNTGNYSDTLGRLALIILLCAMAFFLSRLLNPNTGLLSDYLSSNPESWLTKTRYLWFTLIVSSPLIIIGFAVAGYYLSALELEQKLVTTIRLIFLLVLAHELVMRWLTMVNRKLALQNARQKRKAALAERQVPTESFTGDDPTLPIDEQLIDIPTTNAQTIKLLIGMIGFCLIVGVWMIWSNILPAFSFLDRVVLWEHVITQDNQQVDQPITLTNLIMAGLYVFIMVISVRNFPGLMELLLFSRLSIAAGGRYAVNQLAKYLIIGIGFICIANELGGSWSQVQWLVAALGVGLGFGLQEIFANLVSGIILLFERPIRVGDTVTIGNVTGKVSRIQMRATTLLDPDQKELIVPNKTFITTQFVNWTLSNSTTRIVIPIIIDEGSDIELAHKAITDAIKATHLVLDEPAPSVAFTGFTERGLEFSIRVFVSELANRLPVTHNLNLNIDRMLRENHIGMPFTSRTAKAAEEKLK